MPTYENSPNTFGLRQIEKNLVQSLCDLSMDSVQLLERADARIKFLERLMFPICWRPLCFGMRGPFALP